MSLVGMTGLPSGRIFTQLDLQVLGKMAETGFIVHSERTFRLKSGVDSHIYVKGRDDLTDNPDLEWLIGEKIANLVYERELFLGGQPCLIGIPTAGNALAQAAAMVSVYMQARQSEWVRPLIAHRVMREKLKGAYGIHNTWVNGRPDLQKHDYWMVDNVATDGTSKFEAAEKLAADGYPAKQMPCLIWTDRQQGAVPKLKAAGFENVIVAYNLLDITYAYGEMKLWPKDALRAVEEEIKAHQFV
jgi:orotate phosphoribosyltransferase